MKTYNHLFEQVKTFENLLLAVEKAKQGKQSKTEVSRFLFRQEYELLRLERLLQEKSYVPGAYRTFYVYDPKERMISAAPFRDRVVHHALCNVIEPIFEKTFIFNSYANRKGKGTHRAIERYQHFARRYPYVLKCDIRKFFPSIDHAILKEAIRRKVICRDTLWLVDMIIDASNAQEEHVVYFPGDTLFTPQERRRGLPIGNLTSQFWANVYLNGFDHFIKETLRIKGYIRYVDDFVIFAEDKARLHRVKKEITDYLAKLRLLPHPNKTQIHQVRHGVPFLGFRVYPQHRQVNKAKAHRYERYLRRLMKERRAGLLTPQELEAGLNSWLGHVRFGASQRLEYRIFWYLRRQGVNLFVHPSGSWRVLEQQP